MNGKIDPQDKSLKALFQDFYRVPDYQREYVWGETNSKGEGGDEIEQFLSDIYTEYENASKSDAPEYFIGTIVVCRGDNDVFDLIDGQQRTTTAYLALCALRDALRDSNGNTPAELDGQIVASSTDWQGHSEHRLRLDLQYEDAGGVLSRYARGEAADAPKDGTRSIRNLSHAYRTIREFIRTTLKDNPESIKKFYGYFTNKVKIIRIETPTVATALKIFETINDRGVGLDAMDLLKNLLFMHARGQEFEKLKEVWKKLTDAIYTAGEKPLRFLRYYLLATFDLDGKLREDAIYDWFQKNAPLTQHNTKPLAFANQLLDAAQAYARFAACQNASGKHEHGIFNTQLLGGRSVKQHFILLLAGRRLNAANFSRLASEIENTMFVWLMSGTAGTEYERRIIDAAHKLNSTDDAGFEAFIHDTLARERRDLAGEFFRVVSGLRSPELRAFRLRYLLAKLTQFVDLEAYGPGASRDLLAGYAGGGNDIEHILAVHASEEALAEFGGGGSDALVVQSLGNLLLIEKSINCSIGNGTYAAKATAYRSSTFLLTKCQPSTKDQEIGTADKITRTVRTLDSWPTWSADTIRSRQNFLARLALNVWGVPLPRDSIGFSEPPA